MARKRKTKAQREEEERKSLLQRIEDIYAGATGGARDYDEESGCETLFISELGAVIAAIKDRLDLPEDLSLFKPWNLDVFEKPHDLCDWIMEHRDWIERERAKKKEAKP